MQCTFIPSNLLPSGWHASTSRAGVYRVFLDTAEKLSGTHSLCVAADEAGAEDFLVLKQYFRADDYVARRIRLSGFVKTSEVDGIAALWMRVDAAHRSPAAFDNMEPRPVTGTTEWREHRIVLDVPDDSVAVAFGLRFAGNGRVWLDRFEIAAVGPDVDTTDLHLPPEAGDTEVPDSMPRQPVNLNFEA